jgi:hypothetical protein
VQITVMPLLYGSYAVTRGTGTFSLEPPADLNLAAGWPIFKSDMRRTVENRYNELSVTSRAATSTLPIVGFLQSRWPRRRKTRSCGWNPAVRLSKNPAAASRARRQGNVVKSGEGLP